PVVERGVRNAGLLGIVTLRGMLGIGKVIQSGDDVGTWPTERVLARQVSGRRLTGRHGSFPGAGSWRSHLREASPACSRARPPTPLGLVYKQPIIPPLSLEWLNRRTQPDANAGGSRERANHPRSDRGPPPHFRRGPGRGAGRRLWARLGAGHCR